MTNGILLALLLPVSVLPICPASAAEVRVEARFPAEEARQGVTVDAVHFYAIDNSRIGKYRKADGVRVAVWEDRSGRISHLNSCQVANELLVCAHSNSPKQPPASSIERFQLEPLSHHDSISLGVTPGYLTWVDVEGSQMWGFFAHYRERIEGRDPGWSQLVRFDSNWRIERGWLLPRSLLERLGPSSVSGGAWRKDGLLYVSGHSRKELYVLELPEAGSYLEHIATLEVPMPGQALSFDESTDEQFLYGISRPDREVIVVSLPRIKK